MGLLREKNKMADCWEHVSRPLLCNNAFQNVSHFRDIRGEKLIVLAPKIPNYVTFDLNNCIIRFGLSRATFLLL